LLLCKVCTWISIKVIVVLSHSMGKNEHTLTDGCVESLQKTKS